MSSDSRRERQLGIITPNRQRYEATLPDDALTAVRQQVCPFCGEGPFLVVARHIYLMHGITSRELRNMLGILASESICDPMHAKAAAARSVVANDPSLRAKSIAARRSGDRGKWRMTKAARLAMSERRKGINAKTGEPATGPRPRVYAPRPARTPRGRTMVELTCPQCRSVFTLEKRKVPKDRDPYCSRTCAGLGITERSSAQPGVGWRADRKKWRAWIKVDGRQRLLGHFATEAEAIAARQAADAQQRIN